MTSQYTGKIMAAAIPRPMMSKWSRLFCGRGGAPVFRNGPLIRPLPVHELAQVVTATPDSSSTAIRAIAEPWLKEVDSNALE
ncbi:hypothetical protein SMICM304S_03142 [Streptomyces microflavus]